MTDTDFTPWLSLLKTMAQSYSRYTREPVEECYADALLGLWRALKSYRPGKGASLSTWVGDIVKREMIDGVRIRHQTRRKHMRYDAFLSLDGTFRLDNSTSWLGAERRETYASQTPDERSGCDLTTVDDGDLVDRLLLCLEPRQQDIMRRWARGEKQVDIARTYRLSESAVSLIVKKSVEVIRATEPAKKAARERMVGR